ncbi:thermonuclease family protein [Lentzea sp. HUAS TT2]|uniref:thermonuclease family protein n=1 Tax=Lentzea sp. HUAS TT2 TaxID=3447454 RepID=UPI003F7196E4
MPSTTESAARGAATGTVRRFWWRTSQPARLAIGCLGVATALATAGVVALSGGEQPSERGGSVLDELGARGDSLRVTVRSVSDVDLFEGAEPITGRVVSARVAGVSPMADCWVAESRTAAQDLLRGKDVRLVVRRDDGSDRILVDVELPDGTDYARTVVGDGVVRADLPVRAELEQAESTARQERRGLWGVSCVRTPVAVMVSSARPVPPAPSSTTTTAETTTTESAAPSSPPASSSPPPPEEEEWEDSRLGKPCLIPGARRPAKGDHEIVCVRNDKGQLRWRRGN